MTEFDFATVAIPPRVASPGRPAEPNPFLDKVAELVDEDGSPRDIAVTFTLADSADSQAADRVRRQLARAGIVHNVSIFKRIEDQPDGSAAITFWAQSRIVPQRKPKSESNGSDGESDGGDEGVAASDTASPSSATTVLEP